MKALGTVSKDPTMTETLLNKQVLTTGEVARICHVAPRTVSKWFDSGQLRGYRIPGSRDRRIPADQLKDFMRVHGIPLGELEDEACRVLVVQADVEPGMLEQLQAQGSLNVRQARSEFSAGLVAQQFHPHVIVLDVSGLGDQAAGLSAAIRGEMMLSRAALVAVCSPSDHTRLRQLNGQGFDVVLNKPYSLTELVHAIDQVRHRSAV